MVNEDIRRASFVGSLMVRLSAHDPRSPSRHRQGTHNTRQIRSKHMLLASRALCLYGADISKIMQGLFRACIIPFRLMYLLISFDLVQMSIASPVSSPNSTLSLVEPLRSAIVNSTSG